MGRIDRYIIGQLLLLFGFFALVLVSVYWLNRAVRLFDRLIGDGQSALMFLEFTALALPDAIRRVLPVAAFVATLWTINKLSRDSELIAVQAAGVSALRLARPVAVFGVIATALVLALSTMIVPLSRAEIAERRARIDSDLAVRFLTPGQFMTPTRGVTVYLSRIEADGTLRDIFLRDSRSPGREAIYTAARARLVPADPAPRLVMMDGMIQTRERPGGRLGVTRFERAVYETSGLVSGGRARRPDADELSTTTLLRAAPETMAASRQSRAALRAEGHGRLAGPLIALAGPLVALGALMAGRFSRFGLWRQICLAVGLMILLTLADKAAEDVARSEASLWPVLYAGPVSGVLAGLALCRFCDSRLSRLRPRRIPPVPAR